MSLGQNLISEGVPQDLTPQQREGVVELLRYPDKVLTEILLKLKSEVLARTGTGPGEWLRTLADCYIEGRNNEMERWNLQEWKKWREGEGDCLRQVQKKNF